MIIFCVNTKKIKKKKLISLAKKSNTVEKFSSGQLKTFFLEKNGNI